VLDFGVLRWREQGEGRQYPETSTNARFGVVGTIGMTRTLELSMFVLNSGVVRWRGRKRALKRAQMLISEVVVVAAGRGWAKPKNEWSCSLSGLGGCWWRRQNPENDCFWGWGC